MARRRFSLFILFLTFILLVVYAVEIYKPIAVKWRRTINPKIRAQVRIFMVAYGLLMIWGITTPLASNEIVNAIRQAIFSLTWVIWAFGIWKSPFILNYCNVHPKFLIVTNKEGVPLFSYDFASRNELEDNILISGALTSLNLLLDYVLASETNQYITKRKDEVIITSVKDKTVSFLVCSELTRIIVSANNVFSERFEKTFSEALSHKAVRVSEFKGTKKMVEQVFDPLFLDYGDIKVKRKNDQNSIFQ